MPKTQLFGKLRHHEISKIATMISNNRLQDSKSGDDMIEYEQGCSFSSIIKCRRRLDPFGEIIHRYDDVSMPPNLVRVTCHEFNAPFCERTNGNYRV
jgi:hypothetical protein